MWKKFFPCVFICIILNEKSTCRCKQSDEQLSSRNGVATSARVRHRLFWHFRCGELNVLVLIAVCISIAYRCCSCQKRVLSMESLLSRANETSTHTATFGNDEKKRDSATKQKWRVHIRLNCDIGRINFTVFTWNKVHFKGKNSIVLHRCLCRTWNFLQSISFVSHSECQNLVTFH